MSEVVNCSLCWGTYDGKEKAFSMHCGHHFHIECMQTWQKRLLSCPRCHLFDLDSHKLFFECGGASEVQKLIDSLKEEKDSAYKECKIEMEIKNKTIRMLIKSSNEDKECLKQLQVAHNQTTLTNQQYALTLQSAFTELQNLKINIANHNANNAIMHDMEIKEFRNKLEIKEAEMRSMSAANINMYEQFQSMEARMHKLVKSMEQMQLKFMESEKNNEQLALKNTELEDIICELKNECSTKSSEVVSKFVIKKKAETSVQVYNGISEDDLKPADIINTSNAVIIKFILIDLDPIFYKSAVIEMAKIMKIKINEDAIILAKRLKHPQNQNTKTICVEFKDTDIKNAFFDCRGALKKFKETADLIVLSYNSFDTQAILRFAATLRNLKYNVYCRNDKVMAAKPSGPAFKISSIKHLQQLISNGETSSRNKETTNNEHPNEQNL